MVCTAGFLFEKPDTPRGSAVLDAVQPGHAFNLGPLRTRLVIETCSWLAKGFQHACLQRHASGAFCLGSYFVHDSGSLASVARGHYGYQSSTATGFKPLTQAEHCQLAQAVRCVQRNATDLQRRTSD